MTQKSLVAVFFCGLSLIGFTGCKNNSDTQSNSLTTAPASNQTAGEETKSNEANQSSETVAPGNTLVFESYQVANTLSESDAKVYQKIISDYFRCGIYQDEVQPNCSYYDNRVGKTYFSEESSTLQPNVTQSIYLELNLKKTTSLIINIPLQRIKKTEEKCVIDESWGDEEKADCDNFNQALELVESAGFDDDAETGYQPGGIVKIYRLKKPFVTQDTIWNSDETERTTNPEFQEPYNFVKNPENIDLIGELVIAKNPNATLWNRFVASQDLEEKLELLKVYTLQNKADTEEDIIDKNRAQIIESLSNEEELMAAAPLVQHKWLTQIAALKLNSEPNILPLIENLVSSSPNRDVVNAAAAEAMVAQSEMKGLSAKVRELLKDEDSSVRARAINALYLNMNSDNIEALITALDDLELNVSQEAEIALEHYSRGSSESFAKLFANTRRPHARRAVIRLLGKAANYRDGDATKLLILLLRDENNYFHATDIFATLKTIASWDWSELNELGDLLLNEKAPNYARINALELLKKIKSDGATSELLSSLMVAEKALRNDVRLALEGRKITPDHLSRLDNVLHSPTPEIRISAIPYLCQIGNRESTDLFIDKMDDSDRTVRIAFLRATDGNSCHFKFVYSHLDMLMFQATRHTKEYMETAALAVRLLVKAAPLNIVRVRTEIEEIAEYWKNHTWPVDQPEKFKAPLLEEIQKARSMLKPRLIFLGKSLIEIQSPKK